MSEIVFLQDWERGGIGRGSRKPAKRLSEWDYARGLPYGLWYGAETGTEYLFNRRYRAMARRPFARPREVEYLPGNKFFDHTVEGWFYERDGVAPTVNRETRAKCQMVLTRFLLGMDVRKHLVNGRRYDPKSEFGFVKIGN